MMANASLREFDISPVRVIKSWILWNRTVTEGKMYWIRFQIQTRSHYSVPVRKDGGPHLSPQCYGLRLLLVPDFLDTLTRYMVSTWCKTTYNVLRFSTPCKITFTVLTFSLHVITNSSFTHLLRLLYFYSCNLVIPVTLLLVTAVTLLFP